MPTALLPDRAVLSVHGPDARAFLQGLVTSDVEALSSGLAAFGALLSPQGKILFDFFVICVADDAFLLDAAADNAPALAKRLAMYKLRAKVSIEATSKAVVAVWGGDASPDGLGFADPRADALGKRVIVGAGGVVGDADGYEALRIATGIPKGGVDFVWGDAFPHDVNMDLLHGISFTKGCYVGQEVVSRMQHRGTARRRTLRATFEATSIPAGTEIRAGDALLGTLGSSAAGHALASVRIDRLADAQAAGLSAQAGGTPVFLAPFP